MTTTRKRYLLFSYLFIAIFLFFGNYQDRLHRAAFLGRTLYAPITFSVREYKSMNQLREENRSQQTKIAELILRNVGQETMLAMYEQSILGFTIPDSPFVLASILGFSGNYIGRTIVIDKGLAHGIQIDDPVFSSNGIVGKVITPYQNFSVILPIDNNSFKLAVLNKNTGVQGILVSDIDSKIAMSFLRFGSNIAVGDTIVTSNLSQIFPPNFPVGRIIRLEESSDAIYFSAVLEPFSNINNLQSVFVLLKDKQVIDGIDIETGY